MNLVSLQVKWELQEQAGQPASLEPKALLATLDPKAPREPLVSQVTGLSGSCCLTHGCEVQPVWRFAWLHQVEHDSQCKDPVADPLTTGQSLQPPM